MGGGHSRRNTNALGRRWQVNKETAMQREIMVALSEAGCTVWRNNTGQAYAGRVIHSAGGVVTIAGASPITFGLCVGSADLIGIAPDGRFLAIEVKTGRRVTTPEQETFISQVQLMGGIAGVARSVDEALALVRG